MKRHKNELVVVAGVAEVAVGEYRRRVEVATWAPGVVVGELEDDFHRFGVVLGHDDTMVTGIEGVARRFPWSTCPGAVDPLRAEVGTELCPTLSGVRRQTQPQLTCTHMYDVFALAVVHAHDGRERTAYDIVVPDREDGRSRAQLTGPDGLALDWQIARNTIEGPPPFGGRALYGGFVGWAEETLDPATAEAAIVLRRAFYISLGRMVDLDDYASASEIDPRQLGVCHTFQPDVVASSVRVRGATRDYSGRPDALLS